jgi:hypothetical protein
VKKQSDGAAVQAMEHREPPFSPAAAKAAAPVGLGRRRLMAVEANRRQRQRYKVLRLLGVEVKRARVISHGGTRFRDALEAMGVSLDKHRALYTDRRRSSHWARLVAIKGLPRYTEPVPVRTVNTDLGRLSMPVRVLLEQAGIVRAA